MIKSLLLLCCEFIILLTAFMGVFTLLFGSIYSAALIGAFLPN